MNDRMTLKPLNFYLIDGDCLKYSALIRFSYRFVVQNL